MVRWENKINRDTAKYPKKKEKSLPKRTNTNLTNVDGDKIF